MPFAPVRHPLACDPYDLDAVRRWLAGLVAEQIATRGQPVPGVYLVCDDHIEILVWPEVLAVDPTADLGATWRALARRRGVEHQFFVLRAEHPDGRAEATLVQEIFDEGEPVRWWLGRRGYVVERGLGRLLDTAWAQHEGEGGIPDPFGALVTPEGRPVDLLPARAPEPKVWMTGGSLGPRDRPQDALDLTRHLEAMVVGALQGKGFRHLMVLVVRGESWEQWLLGDPLPTSGDDMVRWIAGRVGPADLIGTAEGVLAELGGRPERVVRIVAEQAGRRAERILVLKPGDDERVLVPDRSLWRDLGPVEEGEGWIGVPPRISGTIVASVLGEGEPC